MPYERVDDLSGETDDDQAIEAPLDTQTVGEKRLSLRKAIEPLHHLFSEDDQKIMRFMFGIKDRPAPTDLIEDPDSILLFGKNDDDFAHTIDETAIRFGKTIDDIRLLRARIYVALRGQNKSS